MLGRESSVREKLIRGMLPFGGLMVFGGAILGAIEDPVPVERDGQVVMEYDRKESYALMTSGFILGIASIELTNKRE